MDEIRTDYSLSNKVIFCNVDEIRKGLHKLECEPVEIVHEDEIRTDYNGSLSSISNLCVQT